MYKSVYSSWPVRIFFCLCVLAAFSFFKRNDFPSQADRQLHAYVSKEPLQSPVSKQAFHTEVSGIRYHVKKLYDYELWGYVVSYRKHRSVHQSRNGDHLNVADLCVVWGKNAESLDLNAFDFWNQNFTCFVQTRDRSAWQQFDLTKLSNNHLISSDERIRNAIADVKVGDQIHLKGWLSGYKIDDRGRSSAYRMSSVTRDDQGDGACETIYVNEFDILRPMQTPWKQLLRISLAGMGVMVMWFFISGFISDQKRRREEPAY